MSLIWNSERRDLMKKLLIGLIYTTGVVIAYMAIEKASDDGLRTPAAKGAATAAALTWPVGAAAAVASIPVAAIVGVGAAAGKGLELAEELADDLIG